MTKIQYSVALTFLGIGIKAIASGTCAEISYAVPASPKGQATSVAYSSNGDYAAATSTSGVTFYSVSSTGVLSNQAFYQLPSGSTFAASGVFSPDADYFATANYDSNDVTIFPVNSDGTIDQGISYSIPSRSNGPASVSFSPNGSYLATANYDSSDVTVFQVSSSGVLSGGSSYSLPAGSTLPESAAFSPNGSYLT